MKPHSHASQAAATPQKRARWWHAVFLLLSLPAALLLLIGGILEAPFVKRRHDSAFNWLLFMAARLLAPALIIGVCIAYLYKHFL